MVRGPRDGPAGLPAMCDIISFEAKIPYEIRRIVDFLGCQRTTNASFNNPFYDYFSWSNYKGRKHCRSLAHLHKGSGFLQTYGTDFAKFWEMDGQLVSLSVEAGDGGGSADVI